MKWLRLYDDLLDDPKVQKLPAPLFRHWINLLCLANKGTVRGVLPEMSDIAFRLRVEEDRAEEIVAALSAAGLIEYDDAGQLHPHNWETRQAASDDVNKRVSEYRARVKSGNNDVTLQGNNDVTLPALNTVTVTREESDQTRPDLELDIDQTRPDQPPLPPSGVNNSVLVGSVGGGENKFSGSGSAPASPGNGSSGSTAVFLEDCVEPLKAKGYSGGQIRNAIAEAKEHPPKGPIRNSIALLEKIMQRQVAESGSNGAHAPPEKRTKPEMPPELKAWREEHDIPLAVRLERADALLAKSNSGQTKGNPP